MKKPKHISRKFLLDSFDFDVLQLCYQKLHWHWHGRRMPTVEMLKSSYAVLLSDYDEYMVGKTDIHILGSGGISASRVDGKPVIVLDARLDKAYPADTKCLTA